MIEYEHECLLDEMALRFSSPAEARPHQDNEAVLRTCKDDIVAEARVADECTPVVDYNVHHNQDYYVFHTREDGSDPCHHASIAEVLDVAGNTLEAEEEEASSAAVVAGFLVHNN